MEFPRLVYKNGGKLQRPGGTFDHAVVEDQADMAAALANGWFASLPEALETPKPAKEDLGDDAPPTRAELETMANRLGVQFSPKIGDQKLLERIEAAMKEPEA